MAEALQLVKQKLGPDAVILHTRTYKRGGVLGIGAHTVVELTAADGNLLNHRQGRRADTVQRKSVWPAQHAPQHTTATGTTTKQGDIRPNSVMSSSLKAESSAGELIRRTYAAAKAELQKKQQLVDRQPPPQNQPVQQQVVQVPLASDPNQLADEMKSVKRMVARMMHQQHSAQTTRRKQPPGSIPDKLFDQYVALLEQEVAEELVEEIISKVRVRLSEEELCCEKACRSAVLQAIAALMPTDPGSCQLKNTSDGRPRTIALIGPTGVGKTTTIAKLAANFKLKQNKKVGLITLDTYRIAAVDQLRTYAAIIGVPLQVVINKEELVHAQRLCTDCDVVLIDTAGRSQRDNQRLTELADFIHAAQPHEVHLVLSSTCSQQVLLQTIERFSSIRTDRIIFTKLDEAVTCGVLLNVARRVRKKLSYITTGQEVPNQIEPGQADRLAALVLGECGCDK